MEDFDTACQTLEIHTLNKGFNTVNPIGYESYRLRPETYRDSQSLVFTSPMGTMPDPGMRGNTFFSECDSWP